MTLTFPSGQIMKIYLNYIINDQPSLKWFHLVLFVLQINDFRLIFI